MNRLALKLKNFWKDEAGQGTAEYVLLLVLVVGLVMAFKKPILAAITDKAQALQNDIGSFTGQ